MSLELRNVSVIRGGREILSDVSGRIEAGTFTAFCGPNGAGKTTALTAATGSLSPDRGEAFLDGDRVASASRADLAKRRAVVSQSSVLTFPFHVHEVVAMGRAPHFGRSSEATDNGIVEQALSVMELLPFMNRNYLTLSGGERKRVDIARALAQVWEIPENGKTRWLLLDEPTSALDLKYQILLMERLEDLAKQGWGIVAVLHDLHLVRKYADQVWLFGEGQLRDQGSAKTVLSSENVQAAYDLAAPYIFADSVA
ncbi:MAG: ATP-binding cassette domain-containing protein [Pseudomonadota bacterium]